MWVYMMPTFMCENHYKVYLTICPKKKMLFFIVGGAYSHPEIHLLFSNNLSSCSNRYSTRYSMVSMAGGILQRASDSTSGNGLGKSIGQRGFSFHCLFSVFVMKSNFDYTLHVCIFKSHDLIF